MGLFDAPTINKLKIGTFKGIDVSVPEDQQQPYRAADALNMIPDAAGEVRKRPGIQMMEGDLNFPSEVAKIYAPTLILTKDLAIMKKSGDGWETVFAADRMPTDVRYGDLLLIFAVGRDSANNKEDGMLLVLDGKKLAGYFSNGMTLDGEQISAEDPYLTVPTILLGCDAAGGGTPHEPINLLSPWVTESFYVRSDEGIFYLNGVIKAEGDRIDVAALGNWVRVEVLKLVDEGNGTEKKEVLRWVARDWAEGDGYNPEYNRIFFDGGIETSPKEGEDNLRITHWRAEFEEGFLSLCKCVCGTTFGIGGYKDRLFLGGPDNTVYYSEMEDPFYIGAMNYVYTEEGSKIHALDGTAGNLAILTDRGITLLNGKESEGVENSYMLDATFVRSNLIPAPAPIGYGNTAVLGGEIVYLSKEGIIAVASKENYDERYAEHRSALIDRKMMQDRPYKIMNLGQNLLIFCADGICWLLDENQPNKDGDKPYSAHQYEGFRMDGFDADFTYIGEDELRLVRGSKIYRWTDGSNEGDYHDGEDREIEAYWETPWIYCSNFHKNKIFQRIAVLLGELQEANLGIKIEAKKNGEDWKVLFDYDPTFYTFGFNRVDFRGMTFRTTRPEPIFNRKIKIKKAKRIKLRFTNKLYDQPFILRSLGLDYVQED